MTWSQHPKVYEINTWVWLTTLSDQYDTPITLCNIPDAAVDELASYQVDAIWLMGIWHRGQTTRQSALNYKHEYRGALPDITDDDIVGSAYAIGAYQVEEGLGGRDGLAIFRDQLQQRGLKIILDFVPNHTGLDHPWLIERPDYYVHGNDEWLEKAQGEFFSVDDTAGRRHIIAHGRDPYFPGWIDTAQLNAFSQGYREAAVRTLREIAAIADGVRCDMAMLMTNDVFKRTWDWLGTVQTKDVPDEDFWEYVVPRVHETNPDFLFTAEVYWNMNYQLLQQGFDFTYDKTLYDRLVSGDTNGIRLHLSANQEFLKRQMRFIENHDEPRSVDAFGLDRTRPAAIIIHTLPGAVLLHDGQFDGRIVKLPVQINRQPEERAYPALRDFYLRLLDETSDSIYEQGDWQMFRTYAACDGCEGDYNIIAYGWSHGDDYRLVVVNYSHEWSQGLIDLQPWNDHLAGRNWRLLDVLHQRYMEESGDDLTENGFIVDLEPCQAFILHFTPMRRPLKRRSHSEVKSMMRR